MSITIKSNRSIQSHPGKLEIIINVSGGVVQDVACSTDAEVILVDWDADGGDVGSPQIVAFLTEAGRREIACVEYFSAIPLHHLAGTDVARAIEASSCGRSDPSEHDRGERC